LGTAILATAVMSLHPHREGIIVSGEWTIENYTRFLFDRYYLRVLATTTGVGVIVVLLTLVLGYAPAYLIARADSHKVSSPQPPPTRFATIHRWNGRRLCSASPRSSALVEPGACHPAQGKEVGLLEEPRTA
jgi:hypothetical protein